jgi:hypothetical protein
LWGTDLHHAEGIYAAAAFTRRCLGEVLAEKVARRSQRTASDANQHADYAG